jgi:hypothetical protein
VEPYPHPAPGPHDFAASRTCLQQMIARLSDTEMMACTQQVLEKYVTTAGRELQRQLMQDQLDARAAAEPQLGRVAGADGVLRRRAETGHRRLVATTVGPVEVNRIAYRAPGAPNLHLADAHLALPDRSHSFPLQRQVVHEVAAGSLRAAREAIIRVTAQHVGTRQLMQIATEAATNIRDFYQPAADSNPDPARTGGRDVLVLSIDATGVNMIPADLREPTPTRPAGPQPPSAQLSRRERTGRTRMAVVTAIYDAAPAVRTAADILPLDASERAVRRAGPRTSGRKVDASLQHSTAPMTAALFEQAQTRDPQHLRRWIVLVDGANHQLECIHQEAERRGVHIDIIVDFIHVLEYLWKAAEDLHTTHPARAAFVQATARDLLEGHAPRVVSPTYVPAYAPAPPTTRLPACNAPPPTCTPNSPTSTTTSLWPWAGPSPPASSKAAAATWSKTASTSPAPAGACPAPKPSSSYAPSSPTATSTSTGSSTSTANTNAPTPAATRTNSPWPHDHCHPLTQGETHPARRGYSGWRTC